MRRLTSIVAKNAKGAIGAQNRLPWRVKSDMQFFRQQTVGNIVIMGRRTHASLGGCLPRRKNVVVTHRFSLFPETGYCKSACGIAEALLNADKTARRDDEVFIIGGASMYEQFAPFVDRYLITDIDVDVPDADTFFREEWVGDLAEWDVNLLRSGQANDAGDEADYKIREYIAKDAQQTASRRDELIKAERHKNDKPYFGCDYIGGDAAILAVR